jgi:hypothetical protein
MAKQQSFNEKQKKKGAGADLISVKVVSMEKTERGTHKFSEKFVKVKDLAEVEAIVKA